MNVIDKTKWNVAIAQSGTQSVIRHDGFSTAWYHVGHPAADTDGEVSRQDIATGLSDWLNGGDEPWWMDFVNRTSGHSVQLPNGCTITAIGPTVSAPEHPYGWIYDDSADAEIERGLLIDAICKKQR